MRSILLGVVGVEAVVTVTLVAVVGVETAAVPASPLVLIRDTLNQYMLRSVDIIYLELLPQLV